MDPAPGTLVANRFQLVRELGRGTMGTVWLANHMSLGLPCAVKLMTLEAKSDPNYLARFEQEARAVAQLRSPHVVRVLDCEVFDGVPFIAMEWLHGEDLEARLQRVGRLDYREVHRIVSPAAGGLARAHAAGIIHRDLKPGNIFLAVEDDHEVVKLLDFGIAKVAAFDGVEIGTQAGSILGTPAYMSPEQARGTSDIDFRSDLWSLAAVAYECLVGKPAFDGPSLGAIFARIMFDPIVVPSEVEPSLPPAVDSWWERAVSRDVEHRFASARELVDGLGRALGLVDARTSIADLASAHSVQPPPRPRRSRWPLLLATAIALGAGFLVLPRVKVDPSVANAAIDQVRSAARAVAQSASNLYPEGSPQSPGASATAMVSIPPAVPAAIPPPVKLVPPAPARLVPASPPSTLPTPSRPVGAGDPRSAQAGRLRRPLRPSLRRPSERLAGRGRGDGRPSAPSASIDARAACCSSAMPRGTGGSTSSIVAVLQFATPQLRGAANRPATRTGSKARPVAPRKVSLNGLPRPDTPHPALSTRGRTSGERHGACS